MKTQILRLLHYWAIKIETALCYWRTDDSFAAALQGWRDVDLLARVITVARSKHGRSRQVPMNSVVRSVLIDLGARRQRPDDPDEVVFAAHYTAADKFFPKAVERAQAAEPDGQRFGAQDWCASSVDAGRGRRLGRRSS